MGTGETIGTTARIIFITIVLVLLIGFLLNAYGGPKEAIKQLFGGETESEISHEENVQAEKEFKNLVKNIGNCERARKTDCGCTFNIKNFNRNNIILAQKSDLRLINIGNMKRSDIIKDVEAGILMKKEDIKNLNCYFDRNIKKIDIPASRVFFDKEEPYIHTTGKTLGIPWFTGGTVDLNPNYPLYKNSQGEICWLHKRVDNIKECQ